jgi:hypothetical protein
MDADIKVKGLESDAPSFPAYGWLGLLLAIAFWIVNWALPGPRTYWAFFPMWLGYCLTVDALVRRRTGTSLITRSWRKYIGLFILSAPVWWLFEALNLRTQNWIYLGVDQLGGIHYAFWTTLCFTTVVPAVFGSAELASSFAWVRRLPAGPSIGPERHVLLGFFAGGWMMLVLMLIWPAIFFPFIWISVYFILEPVNVWMGNPSLADFTRRGDWRPVMALWLGVLVTAFFWEMWNYFSYPKWIYHVAWGGWFHIFEMPLLGYGGYLPFSLELYALYHLLARLVGRGRDTYVRFIF